MKTLFTFLLLGIAAGLQAQVTTSEEFAVTVSDPYQVVDAPVKRSFSNGKEVMTVKIGGYRATIQRFSGGNLDEAERSEDIELEKGFLFEELLQIDGRVYLFYSVWDKPNETEQLFKREINFSTANFKGEGERLFGVSHKLTRLSDQSDEPILSPGVFSAFATPKFSFKQSNDHSHLAVRYRLKPEIKSDSKNFDVIGLYVYNKELKEMWNHEFTMPYTESKMDNLDFSVDKDGNGYFLAKVYNGDRPKERSQDKEPNYTIQLFMADAAGNLESSAIDVKDHFISKINLFEDPKGFMVCAGYYKKDPKKGVDGIFLAKLLPDGEIESLVSHEIPLEVINTYTSKRTQAKNEKKEEQGVLALDNLKLRNYIPQEDGSILLIGEVYYIRNSGNSNGMGGMGTGISVGVGGMGGMGGMGSSGSNTVYYIYQSIIVTKLNAKGELEWMKKVPKDQIGANSGQSGMSFKYIRSKDFHYVLFLDNIKNKELSLDKAPAGHTDGKGGYLTGYGLNNKTGEMKRVSLFDTRDLQGIELFQFATNRIVSIDDKNFAVEMYKKGKQDVMIKVELKE